MACLGCGPLIAQGMNVALFGPPAFLPIVWNGHQLPPPVHLPSPEQPGAGTLLWPPHGETQGARTPGKGFENMKRSIVSGAFLVCAMVGTARADMVTIWDDVMASTIHADNTQPGPVKAARNMAMVHTAIYDAVNSVDGRYRPYHMKVPAPPGTSAEAAAAQAAYEVLSHLYPLQQAALNVALDNSLATLPAGPGKEAGIALGKIVGNGMMALRQNDHAFENTPIRPARPRATGVPRRLSSPPPWTPDGEKSHPSPC